MMFINDLDNNIRSYRNNNFDSVIEIFVWNNIKRGSKKDEFYFKIYWDCSCYFLSKVEEVKKNRIKELLEIKSKIKEDPIFVENWFDNEINKIRKVTENNSSSIDIEFLINKIK